jgi:hypothetical protein
MQIHRSYEKYGIFEFIIMQYLYMTKLAFESISLNIDMKSYGI